MWYLFTPLKRNFITIPNYTQVKEVIFLEKYLSCEQVAEKFGVKIITVWSWIREKKLKAIKSGKRYHIRPEDLAEFEELRKTR